MRYLSVCSGIEACSVAWHPLGWTPAGFSEIEAFPRAVLAERFGAQPVDWDHRHSPQSNTIPLFGDFTKIEAHHVGPIDLLVGGTPCQAFSVAGKRLGLDDPRGHLTLEFLALARRLRPRWLLWENVPGVLSDDGGRTLGTFLGIVGQLGYRGCYRVLDAQFVRVDGFGRAVPQRRRRVFFVGHLGEDARAFPVLFEPESLRGHPAPRREAGQSIAPTISARTKGGGGLGTDFDFDGGLIHAARMVAFGEYDDDGTASTLKQRDYKDATDLVAHTLRGEGFDASEDGTGRGTPIVPIQNALRGKSQNGLGIGDDGDPMFTLDQASQHAIAFAQNTRDEVRLFNGDGSISGALAAEPGMKQQTYIAFPERMSGTQYASTENLAPALCSVNPTAIAFSSKDHGADAGEISPTLRSMGHDGSHPNGGGQVAVAIQAGALRENPSCGPDGVGVQEGISYTLEARAEVQAVAFDMRGREGGAQFEGPHNTANIRAASGGSSKSYVAESWAVRRLTPRECERLQGFPDDWTLITYRGKPAADGPRYKAIGNSMAVNVMRWIGMRIDWADKAARGGGTRMNRRKSRSHSLGPVS
jgi:DNA (cytosine-5)-methyltransferase 1